MPNGVEIAVEVGFNLTLAAAAVTSDVVAIVALFVGSANAISTLFNWCNVRNLQLSSSVERFIDF